MREVWAAVLWNGWVLCLGRTSNTDKEANDTPPFFASELVAFVNPLQAGVMRSARFRACWAHGEDWEFGSAIVQAKATATGSVAQGGSEPS